MADDLHRACCCVKNEGKHMLPDFIGKDKKKKKVSCECHLPQCQGCFIQTTKKHIAAGTDNQPISMPNK